MTAAVKRARFTRRATDMPYSDDPIIPVKVETLFQDLKVDIGSIRANMEKISEAMHQKADKASLTKLEDRFDLLQRTGSDVSQRVEKDLPDLKKRIETMERDTATKDAVQNNNEKIESQERNSRWQWGAIAISVLIALLNIILELIKMSK